MRPWTWSARGDRAGIGKPLAAMVLAALAGAGLWFAMRACQGAASPVLAAAPAWLALATNAGIEEALRLGLALAAAAFLRRTGREPGRAALAVVCSCVTAALENVAYLTRFPTLDVYWRLGYALPIHAGAALLYAVATAPAAPGAGARRRSFAVAAAFAAAWAWHAAFNVAAALAPFPALPALGTALNAVAFSALVVASAIRYGYWSIYAAR